MTLVSPFRRRTSLNVATITTWIFRRLANGSRVFLCTVATDETRVERLVKLPCNGRDPLLLKLSALAGLQPWRKPQECQAFRARAVSEDYVPTVVNKESLQHSSPVRQWTMKLSDMTNPVTA